MEGTWRDKEACSAQQDENDGVTTQEPGRVKLLVTIQGEVGRRVLSATPGEKREDIHLADEPVLVDTLALAALGLLRPHLLDVLEDHVAVAVEGLDARQQLAIVPARDQHLGVCARGGLEEREGARGELVFLDERDLIFTGWRV